MRLRGAEVMVAAAEALGGSRGTVLADPGSTSVVSEERAMAAAEALEGSKRTEAVLVSDAAGGLLVMAALKGETVLVAAMAVGEGGKA